MIQQAMFNFFKWIFSKDLNSFLSETKTVKVSGVKFIIRRLNAIHYMDGSKSLRQIYDTYKSKNAGEIKDLPNQDKKVVEHFSHVLVNGVVSPKLSLSSDSDGIHVDKLFESWPLVIELHNEIMAFTYGKKKTHELS